MTSAHHGEALHHGAEDVLLADQAAVEERQSGAGHQQNQGGGDEHPGVVAGRLGGGGGGCVGFDGLLQGGDLGLRGRGGWGGVQLRGDGQSHRGQREEGEEKQQIKGATTHEFPLPRRCRGPRPCEMRLRWLERDEACANPVKEKKAQLLNGSL